jgi:hypothetical protein
VTADPYVRDRVGRFAPVPAVLLRDVPPIPVPLPVPDERIHYTPVPAAKCRHGSWLRYAVNNCCKETRRVR